MRKLKIRRIRFRGIGAHVFLANYHRRWHPDSLFEYAGEIGRVVESHGVRHIRDRGARIFEQAAGFCQAIIDNILSEQFAERFLKGATEPERAHAAYARDLLEGKGGVILLLYLINSWGERWLSPGQAHRDLFRKSVETSRRSSMLLIPALTLHRQECL